MLLASESRDVGFDSHPGLRVKKNYIVSEWCVCEPFSYGHQKRVVKTLFFFSLTLAVTRKECAKQWKSQVDRYRRMVNDKPKSGEGAEAEIKREHDRANWHLYKQLTFLYNVVYQEGAS
jgi:hypothetical protein